jgi:hypothetical protein
MDSVYNRSQSFGNQLAHKLNRSPVNISLGALSNAAIARTVIDWVNKKYDPSKMDLMVVIGWTESIRIDFPYPEQMDYQSGSPFAEYFVPENNHFLQINAGWPGGTELEQQIIPYWQDFQARHELMCQLSSINTVLQIQYFLKMHRIEYLMCNTMFMFPPQSHHLKFYTDLVDSDYYIDLLDQDKSFYWYYRNQGYINNKAMYWHHDEVPHQLYAEKLYQFITNQRNNC